jgi:hypothetical protein
MLPWATLPLGQFRKIVEPTPFGGCLPLAIAFEAGAQTAGKKPAGGSAVPKLPASAAAAPAKLDLADTPVTVAARGELVYAAAPSTCVAVGHTTAGNATCQVWDLKTNQPIGKPLAGLPAAGISPTGRLFALSRDGRQFAIAVLAGKNPGVSVWSVESGQELRRFEVHPSPIFLDIMLFAGPGQIVTSKQTNQGKLFQVWDVASGQAVREFKGPAAFEAESAVVSADAKLLAVFADKQAVVYELAAGKELARLDCPPPPFSVIFCRGLQFTPDGSELGGVFYNNRETHVLSWSLADKQRVVEHQIASDVKHTAKGAFSYKGPGFEWLPDASACLLYGHAIIDRTTGRLVWLIRPADEDIYPAARRMLDNDHIAIALGPFNGAKKISVLKLPWGKIDAALKALAADADAHVRPGLSVTLEVEVGPVRQGTPAQAKADLIAALTERLEADGVHVAAGQQTVLSLKYSEREGATLHEMQSQGGPGSFPGLPGSAGNAVATGRTVQGTRAICDIAFKLAGRTAPFWSNHIDIDPKTIIVREQASDAAARSATFRLVKGALTQQPIPYFVPKDANLAALPGTTQLPASTPAATRPANRATTRPTTRGK